MSERRAPSPRAAAVLFALGGSWALVAAQLQGAALALLWPAASVAAVGAAYLRLGPGLLGKRRDGTLSGPRVALLLPYFALTWGAYHLIRLTRESTFDEVVDGLYLGRRPRAGELPRDVSLVVDLTAEFARDERVLEGRRYLCLPTLDGTPPDDAEVTALVDEIARHDGKVYVHCAYGHGRSALVAALVLHRKGLAPGPDEALSLLKKARPKVSLSRGQRLALRRLLKA